ncbi:MAG TPA: CocE/NonD family hydrolase [Microlunatus sp.]|nr:CocE/NonD family hydrolase [Microlunatus sp.]
MTGGSDADQRARARTRRRRLLDAVVARTLKMPSGGRDYTLTENVSVPMRDGVQLLADVYAPVGSSRGTVLIRTPYGRRTPIAVLTAGYYATHGYHVVNQSCRGTFGSGGDWRPFVTEIDDGADTVSWLREQPWFGGRFALCGASYLGYTAWAVMTDPPPELACAVIAVSAHDNHQVTHPDGAFALEATLAVLDALPHVEDRFLAGLARFPTATRRLGPGFEELPLVRAQQTVLAGTAMPYAEWLQAAGADDPVWQPMRLHQALERTTVPVLLHEGWSDPFVEQMIEQYAVLRRRGVDVALTIGPWTHVDVAAKAARVTMPETLDWLAEHLAGTGSRTRTAAVRVYLTGADEWRDLPGWPPDTKPHVFFLQPGGGLAGQPPDSGAGPSTFTYDPAAPTPSVGGRVINPVIGGRRDNRVLERRTDVLTFTSSPLEEPLEIIGTPEVELAHHSDNPYADLFVRLCEVRRDGRSVNLCDGFRRLRPEDSDDLITIRLESLAHRFVAGTRIRLQVSGGAHPRRARNLGTAEDPATGITLASSRRTIRHGAGGLSRLIVPTCPR